MAKARRNTPRKSKSLGRSKATKAKTSNDTNRSTPRKYGQRRRPNTYPPGYQPPEQSNAVSASLSHFQLLPYDIRRKIWDDVFPVQVVHLTDFTPEQMGPSKSVAQVCKLKRSTEKIYNDWVRDGGTNSKVHSWDSRLHHECSTARKKLDIRALRVSQSLYEEAHERLYGNTIFAFSNGKDFGRWISGRTEIQLKQVRGLQFEASDLNYQGGATWAAEATPARIRKLTSLQRLHIFVDQPFPPERMSRLWERFQVCPVNEMYIVAEPSYRGHYGLSGLSGFALGPEELAEAARIRSVVLRKWSDGDENLLREVERQVKWDAAMIPGVFYPDDFVYLTNRRPTTVSATGGFDGGIFTI